MGRAAKTGERKTAQRLTPNPVSAGVGSMHHLQPNELAPTFQENLVSRFCRSRRLEEPNYRFLGVLLGRRVCGQYHCFAGLAPQLGSLQVHDHAHERTLKLLLCYELLQACANLLDFSVPNLNFHLDQLVRVRMVGDANALPNLQSRPNSQGHKWLRCNQPSPFWLGFFWTCTHQRVCASTGGVQAEDRGETREARGGFTKRRRSGEMRTARYLDVCCPKQLWVRCPWCYSWLLHTDLTHSALVCST